MENLKYLFGPAPSRRLGRSLGINVIPSKICSMDCIYCEAGRTKLNTIKRLEYLPADEIINEFKENFHKFKDITDVITITGAGEPTLNSCLNKIFEGIKEHAEGKQIAILTNSTMLFDKDVFETLLKFDIVVPSLDSVNCGSLKKIDRPNHKILPLDIRLNLFKFAQKYQGILLLEVLLCEGINDSDEELKEMAAILAPIKLTKVQLGTVTRPPADSTVKPVSRETLEKAAQYFHDAGIPVEVTVGFEYHGKEEKDDRDLKSKITSLIKLRPCTTSDITGVFAVTKEYVEKCLEELINEKEIVSEIFNEENYYSHISLKQLKK